MSPSEGGPLSAFFGDRIIVRQEPTVQSAWTESCGKRLFDLAVVLASGPLLLPLLGMIALAIRISSKGPVLFRQVRMGAFGRIFAIYKFRTMYHGEVNRTPTVAALLADQVTPLGRLLRRSKLDELPQIVNVLKGDMSLVGPRPKLAEQQFTELLCRPGITGCATLLFAHEELLLGNISPEQLSEYNRTIILPLKQQLDTDYAQKASFLSDLKILVSTLWGCWGPSAPAAATSPMDSAVLAFIHDTYEAQ